MIKASEAKAKVTAYHAHNESAILTMLETIDATIISIKLKAKIEFFFIN